MRPNDPNPNDPPDPATDGTESGVGTEVDPSNSDEGCDLCGLPTPSPVTATGVDGVFCCRGCLEVHRALGGRPGDLGTDGDASAVDAGGRSDDTDLPDGTESAFFAVDGMHCTTCEVFVERRAAGIDGVHGAAASYATDTLRVAYDPDVVDREELAERLSGYGYVARARDDGRPTGEDGNALARFLVGGGLFGMMVMVWYALFLYPTYFGYEPFVDLGGYDGLYVFANVWLMTSFVLFYTGLPILRGAYVSLRAGLPNTDLLVALAATSAYAYSTLAMLVGRTDLYFDVTVAIVLVVTAGAYYERRVKRRAVGLLADLSERRVDEARLADCGRVVPLESVSSGDRLLVRPGERMPLDGEVREGTAAVDESLVTGESRPVRKRPGDPVLGGTVVADAALVVEVGEGAESTIDRLVELLWSIQSTTPGVQRFADRLATVFVPLVLVLAVVVTGWSLWTGAASTTALLLGLTVLIVSCPCALGLATPLAIASGVREAAERGIVITSSSVFEDAPGVDVVVLDKTGTVTEGSMSVVAVHADRPEAVVDRAAAVESLSDHPIAEAIVDYARSIPGDGGGRPVAADDPLSDGGGIERAEVDGFDRNVRGVSASVDGETVVVGHPDLLEDRGLVIDPWIRSRVDEARGRGDVPVAVGWGGRVEGVVVVSDTPREGWEAAVGTLSRDREVVLLTGDEGGAVERFRDHVDEVFAGVPPEAKARTVRGLRTRGVVAMVGDGSNDAPALAAADIGIALGSATELATDAADAVVVSDDLRSIAETFAIADRTGARIRQNLAWAFVYNAIAIPLALGGALNPFLAAVAMATSSTLVVANSSRTLLDGCLTDDGDRRPSHRPPPAGEPNMFGEDITPTEDERTV